MTEMMQKYAVMGLGIFILIAIFYFAFVFIKNARSRRGPSRPVPPEGEDPEVTETKKEEQEEKQRERRDFFNKWIVPKLGRLIYFGGCALVSVVALFEPFWIPFFPWGEIVGLLLWNGVYFAFGVMIIPQQEAVVIERFGQYERTASAGIRILCFHGIIDKVRDRVNLQWQAVPLWFDENGALKPSAEVDFEGGVSAPVEAEAIFRIISPFAWVYQVANGYDYIEAVIDAALRPGLQQLTIEEANKGKGEVAQKALNGEGSASLKEAMALVGVELHPKKGILVKDIDIPQAIQDLRALELQGQQNAKKAVAQATGYAAAIQAIRQSAEAAGHSIEWKEAEELYFKNRSLETMAQSGANITMIGDNLMGIAQSLLGKKPSKPSSVPPSGNPPSSPEGQGQSGRRRKQ